MVEVIAYATVPETGEGGASAIFCPGCSEEHVTREVEEFTREDARRGDFHRVRCVRCEEVVYGPTLSQDMEVEDLTSVLLSGAAKDVEAVVHVRDDLTGDERAELAEVVQILKRIHEQTAYSSDMLDLPDRAELIDDGLLPEVEG